MGRRRRRSQAAIRSFPDQDEMDPVTEPEPDIEQEEAPADIEEAVEAGPMNLDKTEQEGDVYTGDLEQHSKADNALDVGQPQEPNVEEEEKLTKEQEIWEGMRDEFHPVLEQLPLSLHRTFTLMRELDGQGARYLADIIPRLEEYIKLRTIMIETPQPLPEPASEPSTATGAGTTSEAGQTETKADANEDSREEPSTPKTPPRQLRRVSSRSRSPTKRSRLGRTASSLKAISDSPNPAPPRPKTPPSARSILSSVGVLLEEAMHSSQEKVNLAQAAYDSADRHIRLLDQAILEQETSLSIGIRPGTHPALLPEISVPRWQRNAQTMYSPLPGDESDNPLPFSGAALAQVELEGGGTIIGVTEDAIPAPGSRPVSKRRRGRKKGVEQPEKAVTPLPTAGTTAPRLKLKVPPLAAVVQANNAAIVPVDPNEPTYCYCNQVSYGDMVGCDNDECPYEWFHLACVGLTEVPKSTKWYCKDCREAMGLGAPRKRKR